MSLTRVFAIGIRIRMDRQAFCESLPGPAQSHVDGRHVDGQHLRDLRCVVFQGVTQGEDPAIVGRKILELGSQLGEEFLLLHLVNRRRLGRPHTVKYLGRLSAVASEGTFRVIFRQISRDPKQPGPRVLDILAFLPLPPEAKKGFLGDVQCQVRIEPPGVRDRPHFPTVLFVKPLELGTSGEPGRCRSPVLFPLRHRESRGP